MADDMIGWHHWLDEHEFEQVSGVGDGEGSLACCSPLACKELDTTQWLNRTEHFIIEQMAKINWRIIEK